MLSRLSLFAFLLPCATDMQAVYPASETGGQLVESSIGGRPIDPRVDCKIVGGKRAFANTMMGRARDIGVGKSGLLGQHIRIQDRVKGAVDSRIQRC